MAGLEPPEKSAAPALFQNSHKVSYSSFEVVRNLHLYALFELVRSAHNVEIYIMLQTNVLHK